MAKELLLFEAFSGKSTIVKAPMTPITTVISPCMMLEDGCQSRGSFIDARVHVQDPPPASYAR